MRPSSYTALQELPLTVNGKLDVAALPAPSVGSAGVVPAGSTQQSLSDTEERVSRVFTDVLDLRGIGLDDNFLIRGDVPAADQRSSAAAGAVRAADSDYVDVRVPDGAVVSEAPLDQWIFGFG
ncbi:hypothetical protein RBB78_14665 [Tunturiibacter empetritectus]